MPPPSPDNQRMSPLLWIAGGSGITPFLAMSSFLTTLPVDLRPSVHLLYACRAETHSLLEKIDPAALSNVTVFESPKRRMCEEDVRAVEGVSGRLVFVCGPPILVADSQQWLERVGVPPLQVRTEDFTF